MRNIIIALIIVGYSWGYSAKELAVFNTPITAQEVHQKKCWVVCQKKFSKAKKIANAIEFYKNSPYYFSSKINRSK